MERLILTKLRECLLNEALEREDHADALATLAFLAAPHVHVPTLRVVARSQRIRAMELRGQAAVLAVPSNTRA